jgi:hypothetical protein
VYVLLLKNIYCEFPIGISFIFYANIAVLKSHKLVLVTFVWVLQKPKKECYEGIVPKNEKPN